VSTVLFVACDDEVIDTAQGGKAVQLKAPTNVHVVNSVLKWNPVEKAIGYTVEVKKGSNTTDGKIGQEVMVDTTEYSLESLADGEYSLRVKARGDSVLYSTSAYSGWVHYTRDGDTGESYKDQVSGAFGSFDEINTRESYLGYGIDIINSTGVTSKNIKTTYPIFAKDALLEQTLLKSNEHYSNLETIEASTIEEFKSKLSTSSSISAGVSASASCNVFGVSAGAGMSFSSGFKTAFEQTSTETHSQYFLEIIAENQNYWLMLQIDEGKYKELLSEEFKKELYDKTISPADLFDKYGTHLLTSVAMGGNISMFYTLYSTHEGVTSDQYYEVSSSLKTNADVAYGGFSAGTSTENNSSASEAYQEIANKYGIRVEKKIVVSGGSGDFGIINESSLLNNYADWQKSLDAYPVVVGIKDTNSLYPIWELIDTSVEGGAERYNELYNYFAKYGQDSYDSLCETYGIVAPVAPTEIQNIQVKTYTDYKEGDIVQIKAGDKFQISFDVLPDNANKYKKTFSSDSEYVTVDESGNVTVSADIPNQLPVTITVTAGSIEKSISCVVISTCNVVFNTVVDGITVPSLVGINSATTISEPYVVREGYDLEGWYRDASYTDRFNFDSDLVVTNLVLYAKWIPIKPLVEFESNGGSEIESQKLPYNGIAKEPSKPTKTGYSFDGWYLDIDLTQKFDFATSVKEDITLYAKWNMIIYTVRFETNGGTPIADKFTNIDRDYRITEETTERTNFEFKGWYKDRDFFTEFAFGDKITADTTLYAKWEAVKPVITFETNGGSEIESQIIKSNTNVTEPKAPSKDGYRFDGWYLDKELTDKFDFSTPVIVHTTLYAKWEKLVFTVKFEVNGGTPVSDKTTSIDKKYKIGEPTSAREHYTLDGWYLDEDFAVRFYFTEEVTKDITLYAKWSLNKIVVSFLDSDSDSDLIAKDGEIIKTRETSYLNEYTLTQAVPEPYKAGYVFIGWTIGGEKIDPNTFIFDNEKAKYQIYAQWIDEKYANPISITVNYVFENGTKAADSYVNTKDHYYEESYSIVSPIVEGYAASQLVIEGTVPDKALVLTVTYKKTEQSVNIAFVMSDGSEAPDPMSVPVLYGDEYTIRISSITGYTADKTEVSGVMGTESINITVTYTPIKYKLTISYVMANGVKAPEDTVVLVDYNASYNIKIEEIAGYSASCSSVSGTMSDKDVNIVVTYVPKEYTVTVKHVVADNSVTIEDKVYVFNQGETYSINIDGLKGFTPDKTTVTGTINAKNEVITVNYKQNAYTVKYDSNGGNGTTVSTDFVYNVEGNLAVSNFTRPGYAFMGWDTESNGTGVRYSNGQAVTNLTSTPNGVITLYAQWVKLSFDLNQGAIKTTPSMAAFTGTITYGSMYKLPVPIAEYYVFAGWYTASGKQLTNASGDSLEKWSLTANTSVVARWNQQYEGTYIKTAEEFKNIKNNLAGRYVLIADINLGSGWTPLGTYSWTHYDQNDTIPDPFKGSLNGLGHTVTYTIVIDSLTEHMDYAFGLFGTSDGAMFENLKVKANISPQNDPSCRECSIGALVGLAMNSKFTNCSTTSDTVIDNSGTDETYYSWGGMYYTGATFAGGISGEARWCEFNSCVNYGYVVARGYSAYAGGITGNAYKCTFNSATNEGTVESEHYSWIWGLNQNGDLFGKDNEYWLRHDGGNIH